MNRKERNAAKRKQYCKAAWYLEQHNLRLVLKRIRGFRHFWEG